MHITRIRPRPSFLTGVARLLDLGGTLSELELADYSDMDDGESLAADWRAVENDFCRAMGKIEERKSVPGYEYSPRKRIRKYVRESIAMVLAEGNSNA